MAIRLVDLLPLVERIQADPHADASLEALAADVDLSPAHLQRVFARMLGESPKRLATRIVLERAAAALLSRADSVLVIALDSGFDSHEGFSRAFRKHFGMSPREYRKRGLSGAGDASEHRDNLERIAPCVGLFRCTTTTVTRREDTDMTYTFENAAKPEMTFLFMRRRVKHDEVAGALGEMIPAVFGFATQRGIAMQGPPMSRYSDFSAGGMTIDAGLPVPAGTKGEGEIQVETVAAGPVVGTMHVGPYDQLHEAHAAVESHMTDNALKLRGGYCYEVYLTDPGQVPDPAQWKTEVYRPIEG